MGSLCSKQDERSVLDRAAVDRNVAAGWNAADDRVVRNPANNDDSRTFHSEKGAPYVLPADVHEGSRLNLQHHLIRHLFNGPNYSGISEDVLKRGLTVLDIGCGSGIWLAEMSRDFIKGKYVGVDITTTAFAETFQSITGDTKMTLIQGNVLEKLPFEDNSFDYVHQQLLAFGIPEVKWPSVISEIYRVTKPGGVIDLIELEGVFSHRGTPSKLEMDMKDISVKLFTARGINLTIAQELARLLREDGRFDNIHEQEKNAACGWGGEIGNLWLVDARKIAMALKPFVTAGLGISAEEWNPTIEHFLQDCAKNQAYFRCVRVTARKVK